MANTTDTPFFDVSINDMSRSQRWVAYFTLILAGPVAVGIMFAHGTTSLEHLPTYWRRVVVLMEIAPWACTYVMQRYGWFSSDD